MSLTQITEGMSGLNARNAINEAISSIDGLNTPRIAYVESNGNDSFGQIGNPAKPFLTIEAAIDGAIAENQNLGFELKLGIGDFSYTRRNGESEFPTICKKISGRGSELTNLYLYLYGEDREEEGGQPGASIIANISDINVRIYVSGGNDIGSVGFGGGDAGSVTISGNASIVEITAKGGSPSINGGSEGSSSLITVNGPLKCSILNTLNGLDSPSGNVYADLCELNISTPCTSVTMSRCLYQQGTQLDSNLGGNAVIA